MHTYLLVQDQNQVACAHDGQDLRSPLGCALLDPDTVVSLPENALRGGRRRTTRACPRLHGNPKSLHSKDDVLVASYCAEAEVYTYRHPHSLSLSSSDSCQWSSVFAAQGVTDPDTIFRSAAARHESKVWIEVAKSTSRQRRERNIACGESYSYCIGTVTVLVVLRTNIHSCNRNVHDNTAKTYVINLHHHRHARAVRYGEALACRI
jgi:hypothetical protein